MELLIGLAGGFFLTTLFAGKHWTQLKRFHAKIGVTGLFLGLVCFSSKIVSRYYFDNPALDRMTAYLNQGMPFILLLGVVSLQTAILVLIAFSQQDRSAVCGSLRMLQEGRIVWQSALILAACLLLMLAFIPIRANYYPSFDSSIFSYIGRQIWQGGLPYVDGWDHKPAVIFYLDALGLWLTNGHLIGIWLLEFCAVFAGGLIFFNVLKKYFSEAVSLLAVIVGILHQARLFDFGNYTEEFSLFFQLAALGVAFAPFFKSREKLQGLISGLLCGLAFTCKQNTIGIWAALLLLDLLATISKPSADRRLARRRFLARFGWFAAGFLAVNLFWILFFASKGILREYWEIGFVYNLVYTQKSGAGRWATGWTTLTFLPSLSVFLLLAFLSWFGVIGSWLLAEKSDRWLKKISGIIRENRLLALAVLWLPAELLLAGLSGMNYQHYFILAVAPACILAAWLGDSLKKIIVRRYSSAAGFLFVGVLFLGGSAPMIEIYQQNYQPRLPSANTKTAEFLRENTTEDAAVLLWGGSLAPYVMAGRSAPSRYFNVRPLYLFPDFMQDQQWALFLSDLQHSPPAVIIYMNDSFLAQVPYDSAGFCADLELAAYQQDVYQFLCDNYEYQETLNEGMNDAWGVFAYKKGENQ